MTVIRLPTRPALDIDSIVADVAHARGSVVDLDLAQAHVRDMMRGQCPGLTEDPEFIEQAAETALHALG